jgi:hypothetical protein
LNRNFWRHLERKTRENDRRQEKQRAGEFNSLESATPLLVMLHHELGKLPAGITIQFPYNVAISLIHQRYATPVASFAAQPDLVIDEDQLMYADLPSRVIPLGTILETMMEAA